MTDNQRSDDDPGELSEVDRLGPGGIVDEGDPTPYADYANQVADGAPKNFGDVDPDAELPPASDSDVIPDEELPPARE